MFPKLYPSYRWTFMMTGTEKHFFLFKFQHLALVWCIFKIQFHERSKRHKRNPEIRIYTIYCLHCNKRTKNKNKNDWNNFFFVYFGFFYVLVFTKSDKNIYPCYSNRTYTCYELTTIDINIIILYRVHRSNTVI